MYLTLKLLLKYLGSNLHTYYPKKFRKTGSWQGLYKTIYVHFYYENIDNVKLFYWYIVANLVKLYVYMLCLSVKFEIIRECNQALIISIEYNRDKPFSKSQLSQ